jgi:VWFA-related protein
LTPVDSAVPQTRRVFLLVLGEGRLQGPSKGVDAMIQFVRTQLLPQDQLAVTGWNRATDFTTNRDQILRVLTEFKRRNDEIDQKLSVWNAGLASAYRDPNDYGKVQKDIDEVFHPPDTDLGVRTILPNDPTGATQDATNAVQQRLANDARDAAADTFGAASTDMRQAERNAFEIPPDMPFDQFAEKTHSTKSDISRILAGIEYLRGVDGEKHLVFVSEDGLLLPFAENERSLAAMANDARVAIDTVHTGGIHSTSQTEFGFNPGRAPTATETFKVVALSTMAKLTGGLSSSYDYADKAFNKINVATTSGYLLGYYPTSAALDGRYRRITVTVNRPGLTAYFRHGYFATATRDFDRQQAFAYTRVVTALNHGGEIHDVPFKVSVGKTTTKPPDMQIEVAISVAGLMFVPASGQQTATIDVAIYCADPDQNSIGDSWKKVNVNVPSDVYANLPAGAVTRYKVTIPGAGDAKFLKVVVYDYHSDRMGISMITLQRGNGG